MLVANCPRCGAAAPVGVMSPDWMRCPYCQFAGPPPPPVSAELRRAGAVLDAMAARQRQLSRVELNALNKGGCLSAIYVGFCVMLAVPFGVWIVAMVATNHANALGVVFVVGLGVLPAALLLVAAWIGLRAIRRAGRRLEQACTAEPPVAAGEPARCRVCGGDLDAAPTAVVRCRFCHSDNVVSSDVLECRSAAAQVVVGQYERAITQRSQAVRRTFRSATLKVFGGALAAPLVAFVLTVAGEMLLSTHHLPPKTSVRYVALAHGGQRCLARLSRDHAGHRVADFGDNTPPGFARVTPAVSAPTLAPAALIGKSVLDDNGKPDRVLGVYTTPVDQGNQLHLSHAFHRSLVGSCFAKR